MGEKNKKKNGGEPENNVTVVLKADLHCEGCITKVLKCIRSYDGVDNASVGDGLRITVVGKVDPAKLKERVEAKTHKKVEVVSPAPVTKKEENKNDGKKRDAKGKENSDDGGGGDDNANKEDDKNSKQSNSCEKKKTEEKKPPLRTTAVLKVHLHCEGCIQKICKLVTKTKGYEDVKIDRQKELVTVTGAMDMTALAQLLKKHLKREVDIMPPPQPKKEGNQKKSGGGNSKAEGGGDNAKSGKDKGENGKDKKRKESGGGGEGAEMAEGGGGEKMEGNNGNRPQLQVGYPYPYPCIYEAGVLDQFRYNLYTFGPYNAPQMFSDENPNACSVM